MMTYPEQPLENAIQKRLGPANDPWSPPDEGRTKADKTAVTCNPMPHHTASKPDSLHNATETVGTKSPIPDTRYLTPDT